MLIGKRAQQAVGWRRAAAGGASQLESGATLLGTLRVPSGAMIKLTGTGVIQIAGSEAAPAIRFRDHATHGLFYGSTQNRIVKSKSGSQRTLTQRKAGANIPSGVGEENPLPFAGNGAVVTVRNQPQTSTTSISDATLTENSRPNPGYQIEPGEYDGQIYIVRQTDVGGITFVDGGTSTNWRKGGGGNLATSQGYLMILVWRAAVSKWDMLDEVNT